jgi:hypothetical protein
MAYLIPPMADEPPRDYLAFVAGRLTALRSESSRLVGGDRDADGISMEVLTDLAGHWRRVCWRSRLGHRDAAAEYLDKRLAARAKQWREDQIYPVEVSVAGDWSPVVTRRAPVQTVAEKMAPLLPSTVRQEAGVLAEAEIAWVHAYRRYVWRHYARVIGGMVLLLLYLVQFMSQASSTT